MHKVTIWHNTRCSKSREALKLLKEQGKEIEVYEYLKESPDANAIETILKKLKIQAKDLMRKKEALYKELGLNDEKSEEKLIQAMVENPKLIERPIIITQTKAIIGRPPELVLSL